MKTLLSKFIHLVNFGQELEGYAPVKVNVDGLVNAPVSARADQSLNTIVSDPCARNDPGVTGNFWRMSFRVCAPLDGG
jgi:hypothetical protein